MRAVLAALAAALFFSACGNVLAPPAAVVGGHKIRSDDLTGPLKRFEASDQFRQAAQQQSGKAVARQFEQSYLARIIRRYVLSARARDLDVTVTAADVHHAITQIQNTFPNEAAFRKALLQQGLTFAQLRPLVRDRVLEQKLRAKVTAGISSRAAQDQAWVRWLMSAYKAAHVKVNPRYGVFDLATQTIVNGSDRFPGAPSPSPSPSPSPTS
jgi:SurA-like N-terminal domain